MENSLRLIEQDPYNLKYIDIENIDYNLCIVALSLDADILKYVPEIYLTPTMCLDAVTRNPYLILNVPIQFRTFELILKTIEQKRFVFTVLNNNNAMEHLSLNQQEFLTLRFL